MNEQFSLTLRSFYYKIIQFDSIRRELIRSKAFQFVIIVKISTAGFRKTCFQFSFHSKLQKFDSKLNNRIWFEDEEELNESFNDDEEENCETSEPKLGTFFSRLCSSFKMS